MKGSDLIQIATAVYGIKWFDELSRALGVDEQQLSEYTKAEDLPGPVKYALSDIATKYMARVESMNLHSKIHDTMMAGSVGTGEEAAFLAGLTKGMALVLGAVHGEPEELKSITRDDDFVARINSLISGAN